MDLTLDLFAALVLVANAFAQSPAPPVSSCPPSGTTRADLRRLKESKFDVPKADERNRMATRLLSCLDDPDPAIRDGVVFEGISTWLRTKALSNATVLTMEETLRRTLGGPKDAGGFRLPFAALLLSEVARADRIDPVFSDEVRANLVEVAASSLIRVNDYRGFDPVDGWRHGVAHGSDLVLQLSLNSKVGEEALRPLMEAIRSQVTPKGATFYTFGEPERLARAVVFAHRRGLLDTAFWDAWFAEIADPKPLRNWGATFETVDGLAKRHNTIAFLHALAFAGRAGGDEPGRTLATLADKAATGVLSQ